MAERAQTFTLEAFVAAILLLATVAFVLQVVSISSNTASAGDTELRNQHIGLAGGVLDEGTADGSLRKTLLFWNESREQFYNPDTTEGYYVSRSPPTTFGDSLQAMFDGRQVRYNVNLYFRTEDGDRRHQPLVDSGTPSDNAITVGSSVTLYDHTRLVDENETRRSVTLADVKNSSDVNFYAPDAKSESVVYNVVRVEVVLWQT